MNRSPGREVFPRCTVLLRKMLEDENPELLAVGGNQATNWAPSVDQVHTYQQFHNHVGGSGNGEEAFCWKDTWSVCHLKNSGAHANLGTLQPPKPPASLFLVEQVWSAE